MKLKNDSPYDTRMLRRIAVAAYRSLLADYPRRIPTPRSPWWRGLQIHVVLVGTRSSSIKGPRVAELIEVRVPKLTGDEFHQIVRDIDTGNALRTTGFAWWIRAELGQRLLSGLTWSERVDDKYLKNFPKVVALRPYKPVVKVDPVKKRYARVLQLERQWQRYQKLATTKLKFYRNKRKYYEKNLGGANA